MGTDEKIEERKKRIVNWLKSPYNLTFVCIIVFALVIRLYFFFMTKNQAHWWDTLAYGSIAKEMIHHYWSDNVFLAHETIIRAPLLPLLWSWLLRFNFSDASTLVFFEIIPAVLSVAFIYLASKELYDKKVALVSSFMLSMLWIHLFYGTRIMTDIPALFFAIVSLYFFAKSYEEIKLKPFALSIFFIALAILTRFNYGLIGAIYLVFMIFVHRGELIRSKNFWLGGIVGALPLIAFFISNLITGGSLLPAMGVYAASAAEKPAFAFYALSFIYYILGAVFTVAFLLGGVIVLGQLFLGFDKIKDIKRLRSNLLVILLFIVPMAFLIFWLRASEDRHLLFALQAILILGAVGIVSVYGYVRKYSKYLAIILIAALLIIGAYGQITFGNGLIKEKKESYAQMRDAFLWINKNTPDNAVLLGDGIDLYAIYYGERKITSWSQDNFTESIMGADYVILHGFEHQSKELLDHLQNMTEKEVSPVQAYFFDSAQRQPAVIIYKVNK